MKTNVKLLFSGLMMLGFAVLAHAEEKIEFHLECVGNYAGCIEMTDQSGDHIQVVAAPEMEFGPSDFEQFAIKRDPNGQENISLSLKADFATKLATLTEKNLGKHLIISANGHILLAPIVNSPIKDGKIGITLGAGKGADTFVEKLPQQFRDLSVSTTRTSNTVGAGCSVLILLASSAALVYAFIL